jgi:hypothetical protein
VVERARKSKPSVAPASERAKSLPPKSADDPARALDKYAAAAAAFDAVCEEKCGLGKIDECYAALLSTAANVVVALGGTAHPELPEEDVRLAEAALRARRSLS